MWVEIGLVMCLFQTWRIIQAIVGLAESFKDLGKNICIGELKPEQYPNIILVIPVFREQKIIQGTLNYFKKIDYPHDKLKIIIACADLERTIPNKVSTAEIVQEWISVRGPGNFYCVEMPGKNTERSVQINYAVNWVLDNRLFSVDVLGVYDADSRPSLETLQLVAQNYNRGFRCQQQVLHYLEAAQNLSGKNTHPLCVANAIYQSSWSLTKEWPNLKRYLRHTKKHNSPYGKSLYMNGHGQFLNIELFEETGGLPRNAVTDGIQTGYRLSLIGEPIAPIPLFCSDDVPDKCLELIKQHRRWFAGNIRYYDACKWAIENHGTVIPKQSMIDNFLLNASWAFRTVYIIVTALIILFAMEGEFRIFMGGVWLLGVFTYSMILPILASKIPNLKPDIRWGYWAWVPVAAMFKSLGPLLHILTLLCHGQNYAIRQLRKVER